MSLSKRVTKAPEMIHPNGKVATKSMKSQPLFAYYMVIYLIFATLWNVSLSWNSVIQLNIRSNAKMSVTMSSMVFMKPSDVSWKETNHTVVKQEYAVTKSTVASKIGFHGLSSLIIRFSTLKSSLREKIWSLLFCSSFSSSFFPRSSYPYEMSFFRNMRDYLDLSNILWVFSTP